MIDVDLNDHSGGPHWLTKAGGHDHAKNIRAKHRAAWVAKHPRVPNPVRPETMAKLEAVSAYAQKVHAAKVLARITKTWNTALAIIDKSELVLRDVIERGLLNTAGLDHQRYNDAMRVADRLMKKITRIRTKAIKAAFRLLRDQSY